MSIDTSQFLPGGKNPNTVTHTSFGELATGWADPTKKLDSINGDFAQILATTDIVEPMTTPANEAKFVPSLKPNVTNQTTSNDLTMSTPPLQEAQVVQEAQVERHDPETAPRPNDIRDDSNPNPISTRDAAIENRENGRAESNRTEAKTTSIDQADGKRNNSETQPATEKEATPEGTRQQRPSLAGAASSDHSLMGRLSRFLTRSMMSTGNRRMSSQMRASRLTKGRVDVGDSKAALKLQESKPMIASQKNDVLSETLTKKTNQTFQAMETSRGNSREATAQSEQTKPSTDAKRVVQDTAARANNPIAARVFRSDRQRPGTDAKRTNRDASKVGEATKKMIANKMGDISAGVRLAGAELSTSQTVQQTTNTTTQSQQQMNRTQQQTTTSQGPSLEASGKSDASFSKLVTTLASTNTTPLNTATGPKAASVPGQTVDAQGLQQRILQHLDAMQVKGAGREAELLVRLGEMGNVRVHVQLHSGPNAQGRIQVLMQASENQAANLLRQGMGTLKAALDLRGYSNSVVEVQHAFDGQAETTDNSADQHTKGNAFHDDASANEAMGAAVGRRVDEQDKVIGETDSNSVASDGDGLHVVV